MDTVSIREARRRLSKLVDAAERGETVIITRRGKKVACLRPVADGPRQGLPDLTGFRASIKVKGKPLSEGVIDNRTEARH